MKPSPLLVVAAALLPSACVLDFSSRPQAPHAVVTPEVTPEPPTPAAPATAPAATPPPSPAAPAPPP
ncbi:MAG TPA: hypothetical protein VGI39_44330, partial [Polyangiaceae bacterium]